MFLISARLFVMKKKCLLVPCLLVCCLLVTGCNFKQSSKSPINYQRRLEKYLPSETSQPSAKTVDLSEGPKTRYDAKFGPQDLNFDIKINTPY